MSTRPTRRARFFACAKPFRGPARWRCTTRGGFPASIRPLANVAGVEISGNGQRIAWRRDLIDMHTLHLDMPQGVSRIELKFQFPSPSSGGEFGQSVSATSRLVDLEWNQVVFYPAGHYSRAISLRPRIKLPPGWQFGSALQATATQDGTVQFAPVGLNTLVDSTADRQRVLREL